MLSAGLVFAAVQASRAHDALPTAAQPNGWKYPFACCSNFDCRAVDAVKERPEGYVVPSGEIVPMTDKRVRHSPDGLFHWCTVAGKDDGKTICLFVPPRSF
ncbi:hypothetical protein GN330_16580 [Nitratireductor sp. CAU 1489]|uniref:Uncharacterized protein n=2 Tax=Nitratireductor arenosus TaxID=2682096 RepID=A0A844QHV0_9HYPH|nr:hypothetical protein [Nitratireductor arenosus]MVA98865.1 hypothetical protein [Nitratireductor arenosus]